MDGMSAPELLRAGMDIPYMRAALTLLGFMVIAKTADIVVGRVLRSLTARTSGTLDDAIVDILHRPVIASVFLFGVSVSLVHIELSPGLIFYLNAALETVVTVIWVFAAFKAVRAVFENLRNRPEDSTGLGRDILPFLENVLNIGVFVIAVVAVLMIWRINVTPLLASAGIVGAGLAFAAKDTLANFFGGISVFMDKPYKIGDYIVLDAGERGEVVHIGLRSTRILTRDSVQISIPNSIIANTKIINESAPVPSYRVRIPVGVAYGSDIDEVEKCLLNVAAGSENLVDDPAPRVRLRTFGDSSLNFELLCWAKDPSLRGLIVHQLNCAIYRKFAEHKIVIPFPQRDVHIYGQDKGGAQ